jgi:pimeloyl-ACP methyl ester carboxylesterase
MTQIFLYGVQCTLTVWEELRPYLPDQGALFVEYPHTVTQQAVSVSDITRWVHANLIVGQQVDAIIGHSMGGIVALELAVKFGVPCGQVILIETNLKPANPFYRNLMTEDHLAQHGEQVIAMLQSEAPFYTVPLKEALQADFDYTDLVRRCPVPVHAIYGDRGVRPYADRISDLNLDDDLVDRVNFHFVSDACHMPMIENPADLAKILTELF